MQFQITHPVVCRFLLLRADMIVHENEVSIWRDKREDTLRLPALKPHTRVKTHVIEQTRILWTKTQVQYTGHSANN